MPGSDARALARISLSVIYLALLSLAPYSFTRDATSTFLEQLVERFEGWASFGQLASWDVWTNLLLYVPFAWCVLSHPRLTKHRAWKQIAIVGFLSLAVSVTLESAQAFLVRFPSLADVILNTGGALSAAGLAIIARPIWVVVRDAASSVMRFRLLHRFATALYAAFAVLVFVIPLPLTQDFREWLSEFELVIGGGSKLEQPVGWRGTLYAVTVHQRELPRSEIVARYRSGVSATQDPRDAGVVLHDDLSDPSLRTKDGVPTRRPPYRMYASNRGRLEWLKPRGLAIQGTNVTLSLPLKMPISGGPLYPQREFTVEGWIGQEDLYPWPVARLVSYSPSGSVEWKGVARTRLEQHLTLGPAMPALRIQAPGSAMPHHEAPNGVHHVVGSHRDGITKTYFDGIEVSVVRTPVGKALIDFVPDYFGGSYTPVAVSLALLPLMLLVIGTTAGTSGRTGPMVSLLWVTTVVMLLLATRAVALRGPLEAHLAVVCGVTMLAAIAVHPTPAKTR